MPQSYWAFCAHCERWFYPTGEDDRRHLVCPVCLDPPVQLAIDDVPLGSPPDTADGALASEVT